MIALEALACHDLTVYRGQVPVVQDVTFTVEAGTATGVVGHNGAGKTSLLLGLAGLLPTQGTATLADAQLARTSPHHRARAGVALVPQGRRLVAGLTVADNLRSASLAPTGTGPVVDVDRIFPDLATLRPRKAGLLSGGQQQQVAVARALLRRPRVLLLDEPTEGLAPALVDHMVDALGELVRAGLTLLVAEQRLDVLDRLCTRLLVLNAGRVVAAGAADARDVRSAALDL